MNSCEKIQEMISAMLDGELSAADETLVREHIAQCKDCAAMYENFASLSNELREGLAEVPASLHSRIMKGIRTSRKPKKPLNIAMRPYMGAAACLILVVGVVLAAQAGKLGADLAVGSTSKLMDMPAAPAAPAAPADFHAYSYMENAEAEEDYGEIFSPEVPAMPEAPAAPEAPAEPAAPVELFWEYEPLNSYPPGTKIDEAFCLTDGSGGHVPVDELCEALLDSGEDVDMQSLPDRASAWLGMVCGSVNYDLRLYFAGNKVIVETAEGFYTAVCTVEEFLSLIK